MKLTLKEVLQAFLPNPSSTRLFSFSIVFTSIVKVRICWFFVFFSRRANTIEQ